MSAIEVRGHAYLSVPRARQIDLICALQSKIGDQLPAMQNAICAPGLSQLLSERYLISGWRYGFS
jgi:hypothetical protein